MLEIDRDGFDQWDKRIIETLIHKFNGGPVGLNSLAVAVGEEAGTLEEVNEPVPDYGRLHQAHTPGTGGPA